VPSLLTPLSADCCLDRDAAAFEVAITSQLRKRKVSDSLQEDYAQPDAKSRKITSLPQEPGTPVSNRRSPTPVMDSDDDMMSVFHSEDELELDEGTQDSEVGSIDGGM
jgi:hypothetical protein